jgi:putative transposase
MCGLLGVARSSFYAWRNRVETPTQLRRRQLAEHVRRVFDGSRQTSGCRRVAPSSTAKGTSARWGLVADLMRELGLKAVQPRAYKRTTIPGDEPVKAPDLPERDFAAGGAPGQRLVGDITYLRTGEGWLYLATVIDLATRMVVGWQLTPHMRTSLVVDALAMAIDAGHVHRDAIFHSDRGSVHLGRVRPLLRQPARANQRREHRSMGQCRRRVVLRRAEERYVLPARVPQPGPRPVRRRRVHRGVLQPPTAALHPRLPHPVRSTHRPPTSSNR